MDFETPLVSILTPCFNSADTLPRYTSGICTQTHRQFEVILVNDGSTDNTEEVLRACANKIIVSSGARVTCISQANKGPCAALNTAFRHARGDYFLLCDSDDALTPNAISDFLEAFALHPDCDMVFARYNLCDQAGRVVDTGPAIAIPGPDAIYETLIARGMFIKAGAYCFRRRCLDSLPNGRLNEAYYGQNLELLLHIAARGRIAFHDAVTVNITIQPESRSRRRDLQALRRQCLDSMQLQLEVIARYGCSRRALRAFRRRFLPAESQLFFLEGRRADTLKCLLLGLGLGLVTRRILLHALCSLTEPTRLWLARRWYPEFLRGTG